MRELQTLLPLPKHSWRSRECTMDIKPIMSMWPNDACGIFSLTDDDKLKDQRECYAKAIPSDSKLCTNQK